MLKAVFQLEPLTCPSCIKKIETTLNKMVGMQTVRVLFNSSKVKTEFDATIIQATEVENILQKLGYQVISAKVS
ncbi:heavy-metal-associated domain-containing protein [Mesobacillus maritimus]|uniref:heavy-metal-associated domain-containing protein n=1 Tax=Mesobacillus maritimus TaxID=1643336 RepID=UPI0038510BCE